MQIMKILGELGSIKYLTPHDPIEHEGELIYNEDKQTFLCPHCEKNFVNYGDIKCGDFEWLPIKGCGGYLNWESK